MHAVPILLSIAALLFALMAERITLTLTVRERAEVALRFAFFSFRIYPREKKRPDDRSARKRAKKKGAEKLFAPLFFPAVRAGRLLLSHSDLTLRAADLTVLLPESSDPFGRAVRLQKLSAVLAALFGASVLFADLPVPRVETAGADDPPAWDLSLSCLLFFIVAALFVFVWERLKHIKGRRKQNHAI